MKKLLIVGASSFIGANLARQLRGRYCVYGTYRRFRPEIDGVPTFRLGIQAGAPIERLTRLVKPDVVVYCAGDADEKKCNVDTMATLFLNADGPALFAEALRPSGGQLIYLSSSKVFSGDGGDYRETDEVSPQTTYGRAKLRGEELVGQFDNTISLRLGNVFGWASAGQNCFFRRLMEQLWAGEEVPLICDEYRSFLAVDDLSRALSLIIDRDLLGGPYHLSDGGKMTFYSFARAATKEFGLSTKLCRAITGESFSREMPGHRGTDLSLNGSELSQLLGSTPSGVEAGLAAIRASLRDGAQ